MARRMDDKVCLISGTTGIASSTAMLAAAEGARVVTTGIDRESGRQLVARIREAGGIADFHQADLTRANAAITAVDRCVAIHGRIDALFNVVGGSGRRYGDGPLHECTEPGWDGTFELNLKTMYLLTHPALNQMLKQPIAANGLRGTILNMGSTIAESPQPNHFATHAYAAAKGAINSMTRSMASYYAAQKIRVNVIAPGLVRTPMSQRAQQNPEILEFVQHHLQRLAGGILEADDVARTALFLLGDESRHITGQVVTVDGGWSIA